jgi:hypothetical protein
MNGDESFRLVRLPQARKFLRAPRVEVLCRARAVVLKTNSQQYYPCRQSNYEGNENKRCCRV